MFSLFTFCFRNLINLYRTAADGTDAKFKLKELGTELFYQMIHLVDDNTEFYPPTRQLFSSFAEVLGLEFISANSEESIRLVSLCATNPKVIGAVAPNINLKNVSPENLLVIYKDITEFPKTHKDLAFVILTKVCMLQKFLKI